MQAGHAYAVAKEYIKLLLYMYADNNYHADTQVELSSVTFTIPCMVMFDKLLKMQ